MAWTRLRGPGQGSCPLPPCSMDFLDTSYRNVNQKMNNQFAGKNEHPDNCRSHPYQGSHPTSHRWRSARCTKLSNARTDNHHDAQKPKVIREYGSKKRNYRDQEKRKPVRLLRITPTRQVTINRAIMARQRMAKLNANRYSFDSFASQLFMVARQMNPAASILLAKSGLPLGALGSLAAQRSINNSRTCCTNPRTISVDPVPSRM